MADLSVVSGLCGMREASGHLLDRVFQDFHEPIECADEWEIAIFKGRYGVFDFSIIFCQLLRLACLVIDHGGEFLELRSKQGFGVVS